MLLEHAHLFIGEPYRVHGQEVLVQHAQVVQMGHGLHADFGLQVLAALLGGRSGGFHLVPAPLQHPQVINRQGKDLFSFRIHPLSEEDFAKCRKRCTKYVKSRTQAGMRIPEEVDTVKYRCMLIYEATVEEDRAKVWDNKALWKAKDLATGIEAVDLLLKAGEKNAICEKLDNISGYEMTEEEVAKN